ncbi:MAG: hypothetical protein ABEH81_01060 [Halopenitus sp.]
MDFEGLIFGIGSLLRNEVNGWSHSDSGVPHVYPDHPPLDLAKSSYPRATVDTIGRSPGVTDIENTVHTGNQVVDLTVYAVNSKDVNDLLGKAVEAVAQYHDATDNNGDPYFSVEWDFNTFGSTGPMIDEEATPGFTRYNKTQELEFNHVLVTSS